MHSKEVAGCTPQRLDNKLYCPQIYSDFVLCVKLYAMLTSNSNN